MKTIKELKKEAGEIRSEKIKALENQDFEKATILREKEREMLETIDGRNKEEFFQFLEQMVFKINDPENREIIKDKLFELFKFEFNDETSNEAIDNGFCVFRGFNQDRKKWVEIMISPKTA